MEKAPVISVLMAVYNPDHAELRASIESILGQTYTDFEFIIVNDGSGEATRAVLASFAAADPRVVVIDQQNTGLTRALNNGARRVRGSFIARQDADDVSYPQRFENQLKLFTGDEIVLAGANCDDLYADGSRGVWGSYNDAELQRIVYLKTPFAHSTAMMRAAVFRDLGGYDESFRTAQDMELWMRFARYGRLAMAAEPLLLRKVGTGSISHKRRWRQFYDALRARWRHNRGIKRAPAVYFAVRSLIIGLLPPRILRGLKTLAGR